MYDPFWTFGPILDFGASSELAQATTRANSADMRVRELEHRVERLAIACTAMWSLLQSKTGLSDQQLTDHIKQMDAKDGVGHLPRNMVQCPSCGRSVSPRRGKCMYCGADCGGGSAFSET